MNTVRDFMRGVASLGGFLRHKSDGEPGWLTIWRGLKLSLSPSAHSGPPAKNMGKDEPGRQDLLSISSATIIISMCGRYTLRVAPAELAEIFGVLETIEWSPRYNIAPTQTVAAVRPQEQGTGRELALLKWGLIPFWAKDTKIASSLINARAETVATKPAFRAALKKKRCLIPADGFYEWQAIPGQKTKQPYFITVQDVPVFAFAGLWEHWTSAEGRRVDTCTIITTDANELMQKVHTPHAGHPQSRRLRPLARP